jgi:DNA-binding response OmpR family regulator
MNKTILIVEDEPKLRALLVDYLQLEGYSIMQASNGQEALKLFRGKPSDLILLDLMMPFMDGLTFCKTIRAESDALIMMLTAKSEDEDKLIGYELGADDYVTKPFSPKVLMAKIKALFKRLEGQNGFEPSALSILRVDGLEIHEQSNEVKLGDEILPLSPKEYGLLMYLYHNRNVTLSRDAILNGVWGMDYYGDARTVDTHIKRLRQKLKYKADLILTVKGYGYKLRVQG